MVGNLYIALQVQSKEAARMRDLRNFYTHRHPAFVDALKSIEKWVFSLHKQEKLLKPPFLGVEKLLPATYLYFKYVKVECLNVSSNFTYIF